MNAYRRWKGRLAIGLLVGASVLVVLPLFAILFHLLRQGMGAVNLDFFLQAQKPVGEIGGGMAHSILGTLWLVLIGSATGIPLGLASGIYLAEYGTRERFASVVRFCLELLASTPSILVGVFVYALMVVPMRQFSLLSGGLALGLILLPNVARNSEELLRLVPSHLREAGLALGIPRWKVILRVVLGSAWPAVRAALILGVARIAGETAPLVFTSFGSPSPPRGLLSPASALPLQIYTYAISPFDDWQRMAWAGALLLVVTVLLVNTVIRILSGGSNDRRTID